MNARQDPAARGSMSRMITRAIVAAAMALAVLGVTAPAEAKQPAPRCKVTETRVFEYGAPSGTRVTTVAKCRGVTTVSVVFIVQPSSTP